MSVSLIFENIDLLAALDRAVFVGNLKARLHRDWETPKRWSIIRQYYAEAAPHILAGNRVSPYELGLADKMTPIEYALWQEIRYAGLPFYLQYPVGRRFVDFGDPVRRIAIEADGAAFHSEKKDAAKNEEIRAHGWHLFRIKGRDTYLDNSLSRVYRHYDRREDGSRYTDQQEEAWGAAHG